MRFRFFSGRGIGKRGNETSDTPVELIIAVLIVLLLIFVGFRLYSLGSVDHMDEIAKSYLDRLEGQLDVAEEGGSGEFDLFNINYEDGRFFLVYFGGVSSFKANLSEGEVVLNADSFGENVVCICYEKGKGVVCRRCFDSSLPLSFDGSRGDGQFFQEKNNFDIKKIGGVYEFTLV